MQDDTLKSQSARNDKKAGKKSYHEENKSKELCHTLRMAGRNIHHPECLLSCLFSAGFGQERQIHYLLHLLGYLEDALVKVSF